MKEFFKFFGAALAALFVWGLISTFFTFIFIVGLLASGSSDEETQTTAADNAILELDLSADIAERSGTDLSKFYSTFSFDDIEKIGLYDITKSLWSAKGDDDVKVLVVRLSNLNIPDIAAAESIRNMILEFRKSGKPAIAFADDYSNVSYFIASACDKVYMRKMGDMVFNGLCSQSMYYKDALDKFGIEAQVIRHGKYKSAVEPYMQNSMSEANRLQTKTFLNDIWGVFTDSISSARNIGTEQLNQYADDLSLMSNDDLCLSSGMIDGIVYESDFIKIVKELAGEDTDNTDYEPVSIADYSTRVYKAYEGDANIAVIYASGEIVTEAESSASEDCITSDRMLEAIDEVMKDDDIKAVVLRVNSPGGSAVESEIIYNAILELKKVKPVVVSMGGYAASGGYYISCPANYIVAEPTTITGSIGVFGLLMNPQKLLKNTLAINIETVSTNDHADLMSGITSKDSKEMEVLQRSVENIYGKFIQHVADGRHMEVAAVDSIGQGRVWTGVSAIKIGLVDTLGGMDVALDKAAELADQESYKIKELPEAEDEFEKIFTGLMEAATEKYYGSEVYSQLRTLERMKSRTGVQCYLQPVTIK